MGREWFFGKRHTLESNSIESGVALMGILILFIRFEFMFVRGADAFL